MTPSRIFAGQNTSAAKMYQREHFLKLANELKDSGGGLWGEFSPHLPTFDDRWESMISRSIEYESMVHPKGNRQAVIPWVSKDL